MALPGISMVLADNALGLVAPGQSLHVNIGTSSTGPLNTVVATGDKTVLANTFGSGELVEASAYDLDLAGGPVYNVRIAASNAGVNGPITLTGTGPASGVSVTGTPLDDYGVVVLLTRSGTLGTSAFRVSFDGGDTFSAEYATAATVTNFAAQTGLTLAFAAGSYVANDTYAWTASGPTYTGSDLSVALDAIRTYPAAFDFVHVIGTVGGATDTTKVTNYIALCAAIDLKLTSMFNAGRYMRAIVDAPDVPDAAFNVSSVTNFVAPRIFGAAGYFEGPSGVTGQSVKRPMGWALAARLASIPINQSPGWVGKGGLHGVTRLYRNEEETPALDDLRFNTLRTMGADGGYYITNGRSFAAPGSDYTLIPYGRIIDRTLALARSGMIRYINSDLRINKTNGHIDEKEARGIESRLNETLEQVLVSTGLVSGVQVQVDREQNLLSSQTLRARVRVMPDAIIGWVVVDIGLQNPFTTAVAALWQTIPGPTRQPTATSRQKSTSMAF